MIASSFSFLFLTNFFLTAVLFANPAEVHHPKPKDPKYIPAAWYSTLRKELPPFPTEKSEGQKQDEATLRNFQKTRTGQDCETAKGEIFVSLKSFFGGEAKILDDKGVEKLSPFFEQLRNDGDYFVQLLKVDFPRPRPFLYLKGLEPCVAREVTGAYPSGHAVLSRLYALILADLYPEKRKSILDRADQIATHRVMVGMHHPSDIEAGKKIGELLYTEFKKSKSFQDDLVKVK